MIYKLHTYDKSKDYAKTLDDGWFNFLLWETKREPGDDFLDLNDISKALRKLDYPQESEKVRQIQEKIEMLQEQALNEARRAIVANWDNYFNRVNPHGDHAWQLSYYKKSDFKLSNGSGDDRND